MSWDLLPHDRSPKTLQCGCDLSPPHAASAPAELERGKDAEHERDVEEEPADDSEEGDDDDGDDYEPARKRRATRSSMQRSV